MTAPGVPRTFPATIAACAWFGILLQFPFTLAVSRAKGFSPAVAAVTFFSFFTILTNLAVAIALTCTLLAPGSRLGRFFGRPAVQAALAVYIAVVGMVYFAVLRTAWDPEGLEKVADILLHYIVPILYVLYWLAFASKTALPWSSIRSWLLYPLAYLCYTLLRGSMVGWYPYPFLNAASLGYPRVLTGVLVLLFFFLVLGLSAVAFSRWSSARRPDFTNS